MIGLFSILYFRLLNQEKLGCVLFITSLQCGDINKEQNTVRIQIEINRHIKQFCVHLQCY